MTILIAVLVVGLILWALTRYYGQRERTVEEIMRDMTLELDYTKRLIGSHFIPVMADAVRAFRDFETALAKIERDFDET